MGLGLGIELACRSLLGHRRVGGRSRGQGWGRGWASAGARGWECAAYPRAPRIAGWAPTSSSSWWRSGGVGRSGRGGGRRRGGAGGRRRGEAPGGAHRLGLLQPLSLLDHLRVLDPHDVLLLQAPSLLQAPCCLLLDHLSLSL